MELFISCDWGTSALRLRIVDSAKVSVLAETGSIQGISATFELWSQKNKHRGERIVFYQSILEEQIKILEKQIGSSLQNVPVIISGMASSNIGIEELPYKELPFGIHGKELNTKTFETSVNFKHKMLIVSGAKTADDAMRGEETQLIGCLNDDDKESRLFIFPGTHSKHVRVYKGEAVDIKTYMTGEFFELLSQKSILSNDVERVDEDINSSGLKFFKQGVADSGHSNILHTAFGVRANHLFGKISKQENYWYLSGLLIGTELKELMNSGLPLTIVVDELLNKLYNAALQNLGIRNIKCQEANIAVIKGHAKLYNMYKSTLILATALIK